jgi:hypothetical protein
VANVGAAGRECAACGRELPVQEGRGRIRFYCNASCRSKARRARQPAPQLVNKNLTIGTREGSLDNVPNAANPPGLPRVLSAARIAVDSVPADEKLTPMEAVVVVRSLARVVEDGLHEAVQAARQAGHTWAEIGELLGTTRQAAFQRFALLADDPQNTLAAIHDATRL